MTSNNIWHNDYSPKSLAEFIGNSEIRNLFSHYLEVRDFPHILISGPCGSAKSTLINIFINEYLGSEKNKGLLKISGAFDRGKETVCSKNPKSSLYISESNIIDFVRAKIKLSENTHKIVLIDHADWLTSEAQDALRRIMEIYSFNTRFILVANETTDIIEAVQSRCIFLNMTLFNSIEMQDAIDLILNKTKKELSKEIIDTIILLSDGDLKKAINYVQIACQSQSQNQNDEPDDSLEIKKFYSIFNLPPISNIRRIIDQCYRGNGVRSYEIVEQLLSNGYSPVDILNIAIRVLVRNTYFPPDVQAKYLESACINLYYTEKLQNKRTYLYRWIATIS